MFSIFFFLILALQGGAFQWLFLEAIIFSLFELWILIAIAIFFSSFASSPIIAIFCTFALYLAGHVTEDIYAFALESGNAGFLKFSQIIYFITPNLEYFNLKNQVVYNVAISLPQACFTILYGTGVIALLLYLATIIFERKEF